MLTPESRDNSAQDEQVNGVEADGQSAVSDEALLDDELDQVSGGGGNSGNSGGIIILNNPGVSGGSLP